jgi:hypothetical protein
MRSLYAARFRDFGPGDPCAGSGAGVGHVALRRTALCAGPGDGDAPAAVIRVCALAIAVDGDLKI